MKYVSIKQGKFNKFEIIDVSLCDKYIQFIPENKKFRITCNIPYETIEEFFNSDYFKNFNLITLKEYRKLKLKTLKNESW